jgi:hypothetical protein
MNVRLEPQCGQQSTNALRNIVDVEGNALLIPPMV